MNQRGLRNDPINAKWRCFKTTSVTRSRPWGKPNKRAEASEAKGLKERKNERGCDGTRARFNVKGEAIRAERSVASASSVLQCAVG